jgi:hypothetical protein
MAHGEIDMVLYFTSTPPHKPTGETAMTTTQPTATNPREGAKSAVVIPMPIRHTHRERDFGVGYGNSSGYASTRRYASNWATPRFKFA